MLKNEYSQIVSRYIKDNTNFQEIFTKIKQICPSEKIWLIGGQVFRPILKEIYDIPFKQSSDFDIITEQKTDPKKLSIFKDWEINQTSLGSPRLTKGEQQIDLIFLDEAVNPKDKDNIKKMFTQDKLSSYLSRVPLNIQSMVFDLDTQEIVGDIGIKAIEDKKIFINNIDECLEFCKRRKISIRNFIDNKIKGNIFAREYPDFNQSSQTTDFYNKHGREYKERYPEPNFILDTIPEVIDFYLDNLPGKKILDIGGGYGRDSLIFKSKGFEPLCTDISQTMVDMCKENNLDSQILDIENCDLEDNSFDGSYAYCSLLHIPKKRIYNSMARISELLKPNGLFFVSMIEGNTEDYYNDRFFSKYTEKEFEKILEEYFEILKFKKFQRKTQKYLNFVCKKKV